MTKEERDEIRARLEAATPGPWKVEKNCVNNLWHICCPEGEGNRGYVAYTVQTDKRAWDDFLFIAHTRQDIPALLDALDKAEAQVELFDNLLSTSKPISKKIEDFCCDEMFQNNAVCRDLGAGYHSKSNCYKCPLYQFKLSITKEDDNG